MFSAATVLKFVPEIETTEFDDPDSEDNPLIIGPPIGSALANGPPESAAKSVESVRSVAPLKYPEQELFIVSPFRYSFPRVETIIRTSFP
jgi:hypothetical protein